MGVLELFCVNPTGSSCEDSFGIEKRYPIGGHSRNSSLLNIQVVTSSKALDFGGTDLTTPFIDPGLPNIVSNLVYIKPSVQPPTMKKSLNFGKVDAGLFKIEGFQNISKIQVLITHRRPRTKSIVYRNSSYFIVIGPGRLNHQNKTQAHNNRHLLNTQRKPLHLANVNLRSVRNKTTDIVDYVITNDADICVLTEAWLKDRDSVSVVALSLPGYIFKNLLRQCKRKVGGTGIMCKRNLNATLTDAGENRSFEFSEWNLSAQTRAFEIIQLLLTAPPTSKLTK
ncbi:hypothetical protein P5673_015341 [Acropora cervicornis]|uniref:Uncharacterized protein n=1 Tax=Acropora cervicornis TaxID=6130 RepID=A0AAD9QJ94_ACRCE|nr:hypothetical protein P5673_015341 [Acropora cervicornis]